MMSGLSSLFFRYDERRRPRRDAPAADQYLKNTINLPVPLCLKRGPEASFVYYTIFRVRVRTYWFMPVSTESNFLDNFF